MNLDEIASRVTKEIDSLAESTGLEKKAILASLTKKINMKIRGCKERQVSIVQETEDHYILADWMIGLAKSNHPKLKVNRDSWAKDIRLILDRDGRSREDLTDLWAYISSDHGSGQWGGWADNCRTPGKLRMKKDGLQYFDIIKNQMASEKQKQSRGFSSGNDWAAGLNRSSKRDISTGVSVLHSLEAGGATRESGKVGRRIQEGSISSVIETGDMFGERH